MPNLAPSYYWGDFDDEAARVAYYMNLWGQVRVRRVNFDAQWEEATLLTGGEYANTFSYGHVITPGMKRTQFQLDSHGAIAAHRFMSFVDYVMTPDNMVWSVIKPKNNRGKPHTDLLKDKDTLLWFEKVTKILWEERYDYYAGFKGNNQQNLHALGILGNHGMFIRERQQAYLFGEGISYVATPPGQIYLLTNSQGLIDGYIRHFRMDARQADQEWPDKLPQVLRAALTLNSKTLYNFFEIVHPRKDWNPWERLSKKAKKWVSCYISVEGYCILEDGGYRTFPLPYGRYMVAPEEEYGRGPAQMVLPALKTKNSMKRSFLHTVHMRGEPAYLVGDDGLIDPKFHSGAINFGGVGPGGEELIKIVPTGDIPSIEEGMKVEGQYIDDAFLVTLYADLLDDAKKQVNLSARQVIERAMEKGMFMAPLGRQITEYLGPMIHRELDILSYLGKLPPMTAAMKEAKGEYTIDYQSWLGRSAKVQEAASTMQFVEALGELAQKTGDPSVFDAIEADEAAKVIAEGGGVPERVLASAASRQKKAKAREDQMARDQQTKEMPARAAIIKAQAIAAKAQAGQNIGGTLSGTPEGGMPQIPGNPQGTPGQPGIGNQPGQPGVPPQPGAPG